MSRRRGVKWWKVQGGWTDLSTIAKSETAKACVTIPLLHRVLHFKLSHPLFKGFNLKALFSFGGNGRVRRSQI
jgi:hypothetical protein